MNLTFLDWLIVAIVLVLMVYSISSSRKLMRGVSDFLAAGRSAGRYVMSVSSGVAGLGAITVINYMEMNYIAGFAMSWWGMTSALIILFITVSGWVIYRFRQTRCLTLAQFFEMRYSRRFRVFTGIVAFVAGLINFGIFPAVGARFFIYFAGLPQEFSFLGMTLATYPVIMIFLLSISVYFVFIGGQISIIIADFFQGVFVNIVFVLIILFMFFYIDWGSMQQALQSAPVNASLINPFKTSHVEDFNFWYFIIGVIGVMYSTMSWQGTQAYNASAKSAHEAKMGAVLAGWRGLPQTLFFLFIPIVAYTLMNHADYGFISESVNSTLNGLETGALKSQVRVPLVLSKILPLGMMGAFAAVMLAAFVSTHDTYLHSWATILIQDVILPLRKKPFSPKTHILVLRLAVVFVAVFIFFFSLLFQQTQKIALFFAITGAIFAGGSGAVIIGGLYWKRGTAAAAWSAMIIGATIAVNGIIMHQISDSWLVISSVDSSMLQIIKNLFITLKSINGQLYWGVGMGFSAVTYIVISLLSRKKPFNLDKLLHRGKYIIKDETKVVNEAPQRGWKLLGMGKEFTTGDKVIYLLNYIWTGGWTIIFIVGTIYNLTHDVSDNSWFQFWKIYLLIQVALALISIVWFTIGGFFDIKVMISRLKTMLRDTKDDGFIEADELIE